LPAIAPPPKKSRAIARAASATEPALVDQDQRDLVRHTLDRTLVVEAAAGTGKTSELVRRMVAILAGGAAELDRIVAVTFTEAAAGELKLRLRTEIEKARLDESRAEIERERLRASLPKLEEARIGTIHSFCADLLREHPVEAGVDPRFEVAADDISRPLFERAFARWFESQLANPGPGVRRILRRWKREPFFGPRRRDEGPRGLLRAAAWQLVEHRDFPTPWRHAESFDRDPRIDALLDEVETLAEWAARGPSDAWFTKSLIEIAKFVDEVRRAERVRPRDHDALEARLADFSRAKHWNWKGGHGAPDFPKAELVKRRDELKTRLDIFVADAGADLAPRLRDELWPIVEAYENAKTRAGCLDFDDLLIRARDLVRGNADVRRELQQRFTHYFVDEFQDTDPLQAEILMLLASEDPKATDWRRAPTVPGKLFLVGDPKQSIYRFRRADVALYREVQRVLLAQGATLVRLTVSFRSVPELQEAVNAAFAPRFETQGGTGASSDDTSESEEIGLALVRSLDDATDDEPPAANGSPFGYVALAPYRESFESQPALIALPVPAPYGDFGRVVEWKIDQSLPDVIGAWIDWLVKKSGWMVTERERPTERVPVQPRHVCILFRRFKSFREDMTRPYVAALEARDLPHLLVGGSSFHEREEIEALRNALAAIERPDDELAVFATLRGPLLALSDAQLLTWRERIGSLHPYRRVAEDLSESLQEVADALALLRDLHRDRNRRPVADTIARLIETTRAHAAFAIWPTGVQALANVTRLMDMARRAEQRGLVSFRAFVDRLEDEADRGEAGEAPLLEEGIEGVRIMTVHKAKGLEFPVVVLADMTAKETLEQPLRWTDPARGLCAQRLAGCTPPELRDHGDQEMEREREEAVRLLYVAATRARDLLVVPVVGDERREGWLSALTPAVHPEHLRARRPESRVAVGCPEFGEDSVPLRPEGVPRPLASVMPGVHAPERGSHRVVWWDPACLELGVRASIGLAQTRILEADDEGRAGAALAAYEAWRSERDATRGRGASPTHVVVTAVEWAHSERSVSGADAVEVIDARTPGRRPSGPRFGTLVHAVLAVVDLDADRDAVHGHATVQARLLGATDGERDAAVETVAGALAHPLIKRAAAAARAGRCRRETSLIVRHEDGTLIESVADLAFDDDEGWTVVDFKTDADIAVRVEQYRRQVALYVNAIAEVTKMKARGWILKV
jgi:ATP-dependent exoDNAse (exonuclease V) beta subunit